MNKILGGGAPQTPPNKAILYFCFFCIFAKKMRLEKCCKMVVLISQSEFTMMISEGFFDLQHFQICGVPWRSIRIVEALGGPLLLILQSRNCHIYTVKQYDKKSQILDKSLTFLSEIWKIETLNSATLLIFEASIFIFFCKTIQIYKHNDRKQ